jgi:hypothetical protein
MPASSQAASHCDRAEMSKRTCFRMYYKHVLFTTFVSFRIGVQIAMNSSFAFQPPSTFSAPVAAPAMLLHPVAVKLQAISSVADQCPDSKMLHGIDLSSARHAHDEQSPLPAARCAPMPIPAAAASACTIDDSSACAQRALLHASCAVAALSPPHAPGPCFQPPSIFSASVAAPESSHCSQPPDHLLPFITASLPAALQPFITRHAPAAGRTLNKPHRLSSCDHAAATQPCQNARRWSFAPPASSLASYAALGYAEAALFSTKAECQCSGAVCADDAPSLSSSRSTASCVDSQVRKMRERQLYPRLRPRPLRHEHEALRLCSSNKRYGTDAVFVAVLLCLGCIVNVAAAQLRTCPGVWSTAALSVGRRYLAATSLPNQGLAIFAGGWTGLLLLFQG